MGSTFDADDAISEIRNALKSLREQYLQERAVTLAYESATGIRRKGADDWAFRGERFSSLAQAVAARDAAIHQTILEDLGARLNAANACTDEVLHAIGIYEDDGQFGYDGRPYPNVADAIAARDAAKTWIVYG